MAKLAVCVSIILALLVVPAESRTAIPCCTQYHESQLPVKLLKYYKVQEDTESCNIRATIFKTVRGRLVCTNPDSQWVQNAMKTVPRKP